MKRFQIARTLIFIAALLLLNFCISLEGVETKDGPWPTSLSGLRKRLQEKKSTINPEEELSLLNVSYDPTREFYGKVNELFIKWWKEKTGQAIQIYQSHGGSEKQARSVSLGLEADVVTLALALDIDSISENSSYLSKEWQRRLPNHSVPYTSTVIFLVRKGNPKKIKDWDDLTKEGISVITPNPKTSGGARWNYLAAWGFALKKYGYDASKAKEFIAKLYRNVPILDTGARGSTTTFTQRNMGDVLITWENEAYLAKKLFQQDAYEIVYPSLSIQAETPVAWIDQVIKEKGTEDVAQYYLAFLYSPQVQELAAKFHFRPIDPEILKEHHAEFPEMPMLSIDKNLGGWKKAQITHFKDGGIFDSIYLKK